MASRVLNLADSLGRDGDVASCNGPEGAADVADVRSVEDCVALEDSAVVEGGRGHDSATPIT